MTYQGTRSVWGCWGASPAALFFGDTRFFFGTKKEMGVNHPRPCNGRKNSLGVVYYRAVYEIEDEHNIRHTVFGVGIYFFSVGIVRRIAAA